MQIKRTSHFKKQYRRLSNKIREHFKVRIALFLDDPYLDILDNHRLHGEYSGQRSINITGDIRAIYKEITKDYVIFTEIGTHSQLYE